MTSRNMPIPYKYLLVIDLEATYLEGSLRKNFEINNFPCVLYDVEEKKILEAFQTRHPVLTSFCKNLTNIQPTNVIYEVPLESCLKMFEVWVNSLMEKYQFTMGDGYKKQWQVLALPVARSLAAPRCRTYREPAPDNKCMVATAPDNKCMVATWSHWDIDLYLVSECKRRDVVIPKIMENWIDLHILFNGYYHSEAGLIESMSEIGLVFEGKPNCGVDNAKNIARLAGEMIDNGVTLKVTSKLNAEKTHLCYVVSECNK